MLQLKKSLIYAAKASPNPMKTIIHFAWNK